MDKLEDSQNNFNYLDYCSLNALLAYCPGESLVKEFDSKCYTDELEEIASNTQARDLNVSPTPEVSESAQILPAESDHEPQTEELDEANAMSTDDFVIRASKNVAVPPAYKTRSLYRWFWDGSERGMEVHLALNATCTQPRFTSEGIKVIHSATHKDVLGSEDIMALVVDMNHVPTDIDDALKFFKIALDERISEKLWPIEDNEKIRLYTQTNFSKQGIIDPGIYGMPHSLEPALIGIWVWDLVREGKSVGASIKQVQDYRSGLKIKTSTANPLRTAHETVRENISPGTEPGRLDEAFTGRGRGVRLGFRRQPA